MPYYPNELIEEVIARNDIVDVVSQYVKLQKKGNTYFGLCPFHSEKTASFSVSPGKQMYYCFGCHEGGSVLTFISKYENYTFNESMELLAGRAGIELPKQEMSREQKARESKRSKILEINKEAAKYFYAKLRSERGARGMEYFKRRGLSDETMKKFGLGFSDIYSDDLYGYLKSQGYDDETLRDSGLVKIDEKRGGMDKFWNRVMFPIMDVNSHVIAFGGRVLGEGEPKYLNSPETMIFEKSKHLYGLNIARKTKSKYMLLCEGYMDVIALHQAGFDCAVASLGTAFTPGHANLIKRYTKEVYLTFDSDGAGVNAARRAIPILRGAGLNVKVINMEPHKDPDEFIKALGREEYEKRIENAENSFMFEVRILARNYDLSDPTSKTEYFKAVANMIKAFPEALERDFYIEAVADKYQVGYDNLRRMVQNAAIEEGIVKPKPQPIRQAGQNKKEDGKYVSQKLLLTWMTEDMRIFDVVEEFITPDDFTDEMLRTVAEGLFAQKAAGHINPALLVSMFDNEEEQNRVASMFNASIKPVDDNNGKAKALKETILKVKTDSLEQKRANADPTDLNALQAMIEGKKELEKIRKKNIII